VLFLFSKNAFSENITIQNLEISKIRAVGDYAGTTYDNTIELWFSRYLEISMGNGSLIWG